MARMEGQNPCGMDRNRKTTQRRYDAKKFINPAPLRCYLDCGVRCVEFLADVSR